MVLEPGASLGLEEVVAYLRQQGLAPFKLPEQLRIVDALPMTPTGKIQKHLLAATLTEGARA